MRMQTQMCARIWRPGSTELCRKATKHLGCTPRRGLTTCQVGISWCYALVARSLLEYFTQPACLRSAREVIHPRLLAQHPHNRWPAQPWNVAGLPPISVYLHSKQLLPSYFPN